MVSGSLYWRNWGLYRRWVVRLAWWFYNVKGLGLASASMAVLFYESLAGLAGLVGMAEWQAWLCSWIDQTQIWKRYGKQYRLMRVGWHRRWLVRLACRSAVLNNSFIWLRSYDYSMAVLFSESLDGLAGQAQCPQTTAEWRSGLHRRWVVWPARPDRYMHRWHQSGYRGTESWSTSTSSR